MLVRPLVIYLVISLVVVFLSEYLLKLVGLIKYAYLLLAKMLSPVFGLLALSPGWQQVILLVLIPVALTGLAALIFWLLTKKQMPYFIMITWCIWLVLVFSILLVR